MANPFKRQVSAAASEALKELYGEDYEEPIGFEEAKTSEQQVKLAEKLSAKLSSWFGRAKGIYTEELENPDSKVSQVMRKVSFIDFLLVTIFFAVSLNKYLILKNSLRR